MLSGESKFVFRFAYSAEIDCVKPPDARPRFVMMLITPAEASAPYSVAAAGPFTTSMLSMSSGLMSFNRVPA